MKNNKGMALVSVIFIMLTGTILTILLINIFASKSVTTSNEYLYNKAFFVADAGRTYTIKKLVSISDWRTGTGIPFNMSFGGGRFYVRAISANEDDMTIECTGVITADSVTYKRSVVVQLIKSSGSLFGSYSLYSFGTATGDLTVNIGNNSIITGNIYSSAKIALGNNARINGSAFSLKTITGGTVTGTREQNMTTKLASPEIDTSYYTSLIATAGTRTAGNRTFSGTNNLSGRIYVNGNVSVSNNTIINCSGASLEIIATGSITTANNNNFGDNISLIANTGITFGNNLLYGSYGMIYSNSSTGTIKFGNNGIGDSGAGDGTVVMTPGNVSLNNNCMFYGMIYAQGRVSMSNNVNISGAIIGGFIDTIGNNAMLTLFPTTVDYSEVIGISSALGPEGAIMTRGWKESY